MKRKCFIMKMVCATMLLAPFFAEGSRWVCVKSVDLKNGTGWFSKASGTALYGDEVSVLSTQGKWSQVQLVSDGSKKGWVASSSLTSKKIVSSAYGKVSASAKEISLAGKGFSSSMEDKAPVDTDIDYAEVDVIEKNSVSDAAMKSFLENGSLKGAE